MFQNTDGKMQEAVSSNWIKIEYKKKTYPACPSCLTLFYVLLILKNKSNIIFFKKIEFKEIENLQINQ